MSVFLNFSHLVNFPKNFFENSVVIRLEETKLYKSVNKSGQLWNLRCSQELLNKKLSAKNRNFYLIEANVTVAQN